MKERPLGVGCHVEKNLEIQQIKPSQKGSWCSSHGRENSALVPMLAQKEALVELGRADFDF